MLLKILFRVLGTDFHLHICDLVCTNLLALLQSTQTLKEIQGDKENRVRRGIWWRRRMKETWNSENNITITQLSCCILLHSMLKPVKIYNFHSYILIVEFQRLRGGSNSNIDKRGRGGSEKGKIMLMFSMDKSITFSKQFRGQGRL